MSGPVTVAVLTVSDRCSRGEAEDATGPAVIELAEHGLRARVIATACVPDDARAIAARLRAWSAGSPPPDLILTAGGTGLAPRDVTPEATLQVIERRHAGLMELVRHRCGANTPMPYLSRGEAGTVASTLIINLPGSPRGAVECLTALLDVLPHAIETLRGEARRHPVPEAR